MHYSLYHLTKHSGIQHIPQILCHELLRKMISLIDINKSFIDINKSFIDSHLYCLCRHDAAQLRSHCLIDRLYAKQ